MGLFFTSGTDGHPKACLHTYDTLIKNAVQVVNDSGLNSNSVMLSGSPFTHCLVFYPCIAA
ncbi:AMP-binding protein [Acidiplasma cupricumulans]|uniref:AMP-binding protein n=1 Tax=Acidiplasma cupricumulans TaxID=312540 RepID=UPI0015849EC3|nr:AMP-binding protein [Acidiplasma cupricumulans]